MDAERMGFGRFVWKIFYVNKVDIDGPLMCMFALGKEDGYSEYVCGMRKCY
jgi:hypothetical protein